MSQALVFGERRIHERKGCVLPVDLNDFHGFIKGNLRNIGLGGAFIETDAPHSQHVGQDVAITIPYQLISRKITLQGKIIRIRPEGVGIAFSKGPAKI